nr:MAG TPA: hypothetical protein [Caudoviricetes sp.]
MKIGLIRHICKHLLLINQKHHIRVLIWDAATLGYNHILLFLSFNQAKIGYISSSFANVPSNHIHISYSSFFLFVTRPPPKEAGASCSTGYLRVSHGSIKNYAICATPLCPLSVGESLLLVLKNHCPFRTFYLSVDKRFHYLVQPDFATGGAGVNPDTRKHITRLRQTNITSR